MGDIFTQQGLFSGKDVQVTFSQPKQSRSENALAINPTSPSNMVTASKKFIEPAKYQFTVAPLYTKNGGMAWTETSLPKNSGWDGFTDPALAFDHTGNAFLVTEPLRFDPDDITVLGIEVFRSVDGGQSWQASQSLIQGRSTDGNDDKSWIAADRRKTLKKGRLYVVWGVGESLRFARSHDGGATWKGVGSLPSGADVPGTQGAYAPEVTVADDGTIHVVWHPFKSDLIRYTRSTDGGDSFEPAVTVVTGVSPLENLPKTGAWAEFPHAKFRILTLATGTLLPNGGFMVAWSDMREGRARIYYRRAQANGAMWTGPDNGQALLPSLPSSLDVQQFHPQAATTGGGVVGVAFYEFGLKGAAYRIDTVVAGSFTEGASFEYVSNVTDAPWDPGVNAPPAHGNPDDAFIGEYFGFDADEGGFSAVWTDTRTGIQELFYDGVATERSNPPRELEGIYGHVFGGVAKGGDGWVIVGGKFHKIPPRGPLHALLQATLVYGLASEIDHAASHALRSQAARTLEAIAKDLVPRSDARAAPAGRRQRAAAPMRKGPIVKAFTEAPAKRN